MGKTLLELFNSSNLAKQIPQSKATTGNADDSQFLIDRKNRLGAMAEKMFDPKTETQLEQEVSGLRPYRLVNEPVLYGTEIIRIGTQRTSDVDAMKQSKNGANQISLGKIGKFIQKVGDTANKLLGIPQNVFPTYVINTKEFKDAKTPNRMIALGNIKRDARGTALGRYLKSTGGGTPQQIAKQSLGQGINIAKGFVRNILLGDKEVPVTSGSFGIDNPNTEQVEGFQQKYYYSEGEYVGSYTYSMRNATLADAGSSYDLNVVSITNGYDRSANGGVFGQSLRFANKSTYAFRLSENDAHKKFGEPTQLDLVAKYNTPIKDDAKRMLGPYGDSGKILDNRGDSILNQNQSLLDIIRPKSLNRANWQEDRNRYSLNKTQKSYHNNNTTIYSNKLDSRRGLFSTKDVLNQTGRLSKSEQSTLKYNGKTLDEVDLIPLRFERVNDGGTVYFRSLVSGLNESFTPGWENSRMLGSPFNFYSYTSVERKLTFNLKVYAMSQAELVMMWRRLEFLAHCAYPYQYNAGIIEPTLLYFTFGNLYVNKACFLDSLTYSIEDNENLWEIGGGMLKTTSGAMESPFNNNFYGGALNGEENSKENGKGGKIIESKLNVTNKSGTSFQTKYNTIDSGSFNTLLYDKSTGKSNIKTETHTIKTDQGNYNMDNYKLPKFINASVGLTFIETKSTTDYNIYGYGKKIGTGK